MSGERPQVFEMKDLVFFIYFFFIIKNKSICDRITSLNCLLFLQTTHISLYFCFFLQTSLADGPRDKRGQSKSKENLGNRLTHKNTDRPVSQSSNYFLTPPTSLWSPYFFSSWGPRDLHANTCILPLASGIWVIWVWAGTATAGLGVESDQSDTQWGEGLDQCSEDSGDGVR